jgi:hypothetical protein
METLGLVFSSGYEFVFAVEDFRLCGELHVFRYKYTVLCIVVQWYSSTGVLQYQVKYYSTIVRKKVNNGTVLYYTVLVYAFLS